MVKYLNTLKFEFYNFIEDLPQGEKDEIITSNDPNSCIVPDSSNSYSVGIVIDGYHVRSAITPTTGLTCEALASWIDDLGFWLIKEHQHDVMRWAPFVAWDAEIAEDDLQWPGFANLPAKEQDRFLRARSQHLTGNTTNHFDALWHFYALHVERKASSLDASGQKRPTLVWPRQSGIDARITTDLFKHALDGVDHIILVTRDADYADPLRAIKTYFKNIQIDVLTMNVRPPKEFDGIAQRLWKGKWDGQNMTVECVPPSPKN